jgi:hypothetical protein
MKFPIYDEKCPNRHKTLKSLQFPKHNKYEHQSTLPHY